FIPKPIEAAIVINDFILARKRTQKNIGYFHYQKAHDLFKVPTGDIIYFESVNREVRIAMNKGEDFFYGSLDEVAMKLSGYQFLQIHRSYLINYNHISVLRYSEVVMSNGVTLPISRSKRQELRSLQINTI
ncbi:MAG: LytTR family DNA-binding domain-containing protein, partial [Acetivibrio sp.]